MVQKRFRLSAWVSSNNPSVIKATIKAFVGSNGTIKPTEDGFEINAELEGDSAKDLNRKLLSEMRRMEKRTRLRAEWTCGNTIEKFFDYVPKGIHKAAK